MICSATVPGRDQWAAGSQPLAGHKAAHMLTKPAQVYVQHERDRRHVAQQLLSVSRLLTELAYMHSKREVTDMSPVKSAAARGSKLTQVCSNWFGTQNGPGKAQLLRLDTSEVARTFRSCAPDGKLLGNC
jgi:hypothetical protein